MTVRKHNIETLKRLIAAHNFHTRDFLLTAGRVRPPKRERLRRRIAQLMFRCGLSAHDLHHHEAAAAYTQDRVHRDGEWQTEQHDVTEGFEAIFDLANAEVGWIKFPKGAAPEMALKPVEEDIGERPSGDHKEGLRLIVKIPGDDAGPRELISTAYAVWHGIDELHDQYLATEESTKGLLPVVVLSDVKVIESANGASHEPTFSIVDWVPRPSDLPANGIPPTKPKPKKSKPAGTARGDMDDEIPF